MMYQEGTVAALSIGEFDIEVEVNAAEEYVVSIYQWMLKVHPEELVTKVLVQATPFTYSSDSKEYFDELVADYNRIVFWN